MKPTLNPPKEILINYIKQYGMESLLYHLTEIVWDTKELDKEYLQNLWLKLNRVLIEYQDRNK
jgi:hypothetical protein